MLYTQRIQWGFEAASNGVAAMLLYLTHWGRIRLPHTIPHITPGACLWREGGALSTGPRYRDQTKKNRGLSNRLVQRKRSKSSIIILRLTLCNYLHRASDTSCIISSLGCFVLPMLYYLCHIMLPLGSTT